MEEDLLVLTFQIHDLLADHPSLTLELPLRIASFVKYLVTVSPRPEGLREISENSGARTRSVTRSQTISYPSNWSEKDIRTAVFEDYRIRTKPHRQHPTYQPFAERDNTNRPPGTTPQPIEPREMAGSSASAATVSQAHIEALVNKAVEDALAKYAVAAAKTSPPDPSVSTDGGSIAGAPRGESRWVSSELGFFDPNYDEKSISTGNAIEHDGTKTYFRDVHLFVQRAKEMVITKGAAVVRNNLWMCLQGEALEWWHSELDDDKREMTKLAGSRDTSIGQWERLLLRRFQQPSNIAMDAILHEKYTIRDAANRREPREYVQKMLRSAKDAGMTSVQNQLDIIYNGIDNEVRQSDLRRPKEGTTLSEFLQDMDECKHDWWARAKAPRSHRSLVFNLVSSKQEEDLISPFLVHFNGLFKRLFNRTSRFFRISISFLIENLIVLRKLVRLTCLSSYRDTSTKDIWLHPVMAFNTTDIHNRQDNILAIRTTYPT